MARVMTSGSVSKAGRPTLGGSEECLSFHLSSTNTYNETKKESRSSMAPSFGESLVHQHTILAPSRFFAITHQTSKLLEERQGYDFRVRELLERLVAVGGGVEQRVNVIHQAEQDRDRLFQRGEGGSMLSVSHPRFLSLGVRMAPVLPSNHATDI